MRWSVHTLLAIWKGQLGIICLPRMRNGRNRHRGADDGVQDVDLVAVDSAEAPVSILIEVVMVSGEFYVMSAVVCC